MNNIRPYESAYDLLLDECDMEGIDPELLDYLTNFDAFEAITYYVVDSETVLFCDSCNGDVVSDCPLAEFLPRLSQYYYETV